MDSRLKLQLLAAAALADGSLDDSEMEVIADFARESGLADDELRVLLTTPPPPGAVAALALDERDELLSDLIKVVLADGIVRAAETEFLNNFGATLGYSASQVSAALNTARGGLGYREPKAPAPAAEVANARLVTEGEAGVSVNLSEVLSAPADPRGLGRYGAPGPKQGSAGPLRAREPAQSSGLTLVVVLVALAGLGWFFLGSGSPGEPAEISAARYFNVEAAPTLAAFKGKKAVLVEFWATWCPPCRRSIPKLNRLHEEYGDRLAIIGLSDEPESKVGRFVADREMSYIVGAGSSSKDDYGVRGIPAAFLIDREGAVIWNGNPLDSELEREIVKLFEG